MQPAVAAHDVHGCLLLAMHGYAAIAAGCMAAPVAGSCFLLCCGQYIQWINHAFDMFCTKVEVLHGLRNIGMSQQSLYSRQIGTIIEQVSGKAVADGMYGKLFVAKPGLCQCHGHSMLNGTLTVFVSFFSSVEQKIDRPVQEVIGP